MIARSSNCKAENDNKFKAIDQRVRGLDKFSTELKNIQDPEAVNKRIEDATKKLESD